MLTQAYNRSNPRPRNAKPRVRNRPLEARKARGAGPNPSVGSSSSQKPVSRITKDATEMTPNTKAALTSSGGPPSRYSWNATMDNRIVKSSPIMAKTADLTLLFFMVYGVPFYIFD